MADGAVARSQYLEIKTELDNLKHNTQAMRGQLTIAQNALKMFERLYLDMMAERDTYRDQFRREAKISENLRTQLGQVDHV